MFIEASDLIILLNLPNPLRKDKKLNVDCQQKSANLLFYNDLYFPNVKYFLKFFHFRQIFIIIGLI